MGGYLQSSRALLSSDLRWTGSDRLGTVLGEDRDENLSRRTLILHVSRLLTRLLLVWGRSRGGYYLEPGNQGSLSSWYLRVVGQSMPGRSGKLPGV